MNHESPAPTLTRRKFEADVDGVEPCAVLSPALKTPRTSSRCGVTHAAAPVEEESALQKEAEVAVESEVEVHDDGNEAGAGECADPYADTRQQMMQQRHEFEVILKKHSTELQGLQEQMARDAARMVHEKLQRVEGKLNKLGVLMRAHEQSSHLMTEFMGRCSSLLDAPADAVAPGETPCDDAGLAPAVTDGEPTQTTAIVNEHA